MTRLRPSPEQLQSIGVYALVVLSCVLVAALKGPTRRPLAPPAELPPLAAAPVPAPWPAEEVARYLKLEGTRRASEPPAVASKAMIVGTTNPFAIHAGLEVMKRGGNAVDAALTTSLAQIALNAGAAVSYAGMLTAVYYDASSGRVHTLNASFNTVRGEDSPLTIPRMGEASGRTALVPGFMAGVQALHARFGRQPWATLFGPSIWIAENGFPVDRRLVDWMKSPASSIGRLPEAKRVFTRPDGQPYAVDDTFRQPELAHTLRRVAAEGADYMYRGEWARRCVQLVQREGGRMALDDLANYRVRWDDTARISYHGYDVVALGAPNFGGALTLGSLKLADVAELKKHGSPTSSAESLYRLIQINRLQSRLVYMPEFNRQSQFADVVPFPEALLTTATAQRLWKYLEQQRPAAPPTEPSAPGHSAGVVAVDEQGNVVTILHSINTVLWGATGIFVDGISIPDPATFQQQKIQDAGPGVRLPEGTNPLLVLRDGRPVLASVAIGSALHPATLHALINVLDYGLDPQPAVDAPGTHGPFSGDGKIKPDYAKEAFGKDEFPESVLADLRARGQPVEIVKSHAQAGYWAGIRLDRVNGKLLGGTSAKLNGIVAGY